MDWEPFVRVNPKFLRPAEVETLRGDATKAKETFGWEPKTPFNVWVEKMVMVDIKRLENRG